MKAPRSVVVLRAQPPHRGHFWLIRQALERGERLAIVLGSCRQARTPRNPFTQAERVTMIRLGLTVEEQERIDFLGVRDYYDNRRWAADVRSQVQQLGAHGRQVVLVGHEKDQTTRYLRLFEGWDLQTLPREMEGDATTIRNAILSTQQPAIGLLAVEDLLHPAILEYLKVHTTRPEWKQIRLEKGKYDAEEKKWGPMPYTRFTLCADCVISWGDEVLLIRRGPGIGEGLLAMPGGHVEGNETTYEAALRELTEEVGIGLMPAEFDHALIGKEFLEAPGRSQRPGRIVSMAYRFDIRSAKRPVIETLSDEATPEWIGIARLPEMEEEFFEDHFMALDHFFSLTGKSAAQ